MGVGAYVAFGLYSLIGLLHWFVSWRGVKLVRAFPAIRRQELVALSQRKRRSVWLRTRQWLSQAVTRTRLLLWWPANVVLGVSNRASTPAISIAKARVRPVDTFDGLFFVVGVVLLVVGSMSIQDRLPVALWTVLFLAVIILKCLAILLSGESYYATFRSRPGSPYLRFCLGVVVDGIGLIGLAFVVTALDAGGPLTFTRQSLVDVPWSLLPQNVIKAVVADLGSLSMFRLALCVAAVLAYFLLITQIVKVGRFRRTADDLRALAYNFIRLGEYAEARQWADKLGPNPYAVRLRIAIHIGSGRLAKAWEAEEQYLPVTGVTPEPDLIWYNLYMMSKDLPLSQEARWAVFDLGVTRGVTDGTLAMSIDQAMMTGFDPRVIERNFRLHGVDLARFPVTIAAARFMTGDISGAIESFGDRRYEKDDWTGHVAIFLKGICEFMADSSIDDAGEADDPVDEEATLRAMFNQAADPPLQRILEADLARLTIHQRLYVGGYLTALHNLALEIYPVRAAQIKYLISEVVEGTGFSVDEVLANQRAIQFVFSDSPAAVIDGLMDNDGPNLSPGVTAR